MDTWSEPGWPRDCWVISPGSFPTRAWEVLVTVTFRSSVFDTAATEPVIWIFFWEP